MIPVFDPVTLSMTLPAGSTILVGSGGVTVQLPSYLKGTTVSEADPTRRDDPPAGDPNAPLPDNAPPFIRAFYDAVTALLADNPDPTAAEALRICVDFVLRHIPPHASPR